MVPAGLVTCVLGFSMPASAGQVIFDFNSLASGVAATGGTGVNGSIQNYMRSLLTGGASVTVSSGAVTEKTYTGDGHVTGPGTTSVTSLTLGTSDGSTQHLTTFDTFVRNSSSATGFTFTFTGGFIIDSVQFDYEIFPDASCTELISAECGGAAVGGIFPNQPDLKFSTNFGQVFQYYGRAPGSGSGASTYVESPCTDGNSTTPCASSLGESTERTPQLIGTTALLNVGGATSLTFMDWPATIGIDNLKINFRDTPTQQSAVPEPGSMLLLGTGLAALAARRRRKAAASASMA
jgi:hypothetical protein